MKITKTHLRRIIKEDVSRVTARYADLGGRGQPHADHPHIASLLEMRQQIGALSNDLADKLGGSASIQDAQEYLDDAATAIARAIDEISYAIEEKQ